MKKIYLTIPLLTLALIATGCAADKTTTSANTNSADTNVNSSADVNTNQPEATNTNVTPTEEGGDTAEDATVTEEVDEYEGWATYMNEEYGFSFKYPSDWSVDGSHNGVNVRKGNQHIKFYIENFEEAPDNIGEQYALLNTKDQLIAFKAFIEENSNYSVNSIPVKLYYSYDVEGAGFYKGADLFIDNNHIKISMVVNPEEITYPNHAFNEETREWAADIVTQLDQGQLLSSEENDNVEKFIAILQSLQNS